MIKKKISTEEELEQKLKQQLNNFNPSEVETYLEVLLKKCLEATIKKDYLALGNAEDILNKSIVIFTYKISNFNLMYSNIKLKVASEYLANYIELDNTKALNFFNVLPDFYERPKETIEEKTAEELLIKIKCYCHYIEDYRYCLDVALNFYYDFNVLFGTATSGGAFNIMIRSLIIGFYERLEKAFNEVEKYSDYGEDLADSLFIGSKKENKTNWQILYFIKTTAEIKEEYEEFKTNPFYEYSKNRAEGIISKLFGFKKPFEDIDSFKKSLTKEKDLIIVNWLFKSITSNIPTYDFKNFELIPSRRRTLKLNEQEKNIIEKFIRTNINLFKELPPEILKNLGLNEEDIYKANEKTIRTKKFF